MKILVYTSSTGGGHDMRARSLKNWAATLDWDEEVPVDIVQLLENTGWSYNAGVKTYNWIQKNAPALHHLYFNALELIRPCALTSLMPNRDRFDAMMADHKPDVVVSVHGSLNHGFLTWAKETFGKEVPFVTYCGELYGGYGFSRNWVNPEADLFIGAVQETIDAAQSWGMAPERCWVGGFMLNPAFWEPRMTPEEKETWITTNLDLDPAKPILCLSTGAVGANNHLAFLNALQDGGLECQVAVICGRNEEIRSAVDAWATSKNAAHRIKTLGYTHNMPKLMQSVSCIVAKPGTGTTSEAILSGCPILLNGLGGVMPQEGITLKFCKHHGFARPLNRADQLPGLIRPWFEQPAALEEIRAKMLAARPGGHPREILERLRDLVKSMKKI